MAIPGANLPATAFRTDEIIESTATPQEARKLSMDDTHKGIREREWGLSARVDPSVTFEEYRFWAKIEREMEIEEEKEFRLKRGPTTLISTIKGRFSKGVHDENRRRIAAGVNNDGGAVDEKADGSGDMSPIPPPDADIYDRNAEWRQAARALRTTSWGTIFFMVTTDILGWSGTPFVFASVGYGLGVGVFLIFGIAAAFSGFIIWRTFLALDSSRFPVVSFGDPFLRIFGPKARNFINVTQAFQMFLTVAVLNFGQAQILTQIAKEKVCFEVVIMIITVWGMLSGSIRSLQRLAWMCNVTVWLNVINFVIICAAAGVFKPAYSVINAGTYIKTSGNIKTFTGVPPSAFQQQTPNVAAAELNGVNQMIYAYSGALLFVAFLAEMRHPLDFWKGMLLAQTFICVVYIFFGVFVYSFWGQYSGSSIGQVIPLYSLQTTGNVLTLVSGMIAIFLYFNIGMKVVYQEVFQEVFKFPPIITKKGRIYWYALGPFYWICSFIFASGVPNLNALVSIVSGVFSLNFTYSIPGIMYAGLLVQDAATLPGEGFDPHTGVTTRHDGGVKRWLRGLRKSWMVSLPVIIFVMCGLACSGLGTWAAIEGAIAIFKPGGTKATPFGCASPV